MATDFSWNSNDQFIGPGWPLNDLCDLCPVSRSKKLIWDEICFDQSWVRWHCDPAITHIPTNTHKSRCQNSFVGKSCSVGQMQSKVIILFLSRFIIETESALHILFAFISCCFAFVLQVDTLRQFQVVISRFKCLSHRLNWYCQSGNFYTYFLTSVSFQFAELNCTKKLLHCNDNEMKPIICSQVDLLFCTWIPFREVDIIYTSILWWKGRIP